MLIKPSSEHRNLCVMTCKWIKLDQYKLLITYLYTANILFLKCAHSATYCIDLHLAEAFECREEPSSHFTDLQLLYQVFTDFTGITSRTHTLHIKAITVKKLKSFFSLKTWFAILLEEAATLFSSKHTYNTKSIQHQNQL